jgi:hypothetical protein
MGGWVISATPRPLHSQKTDFTHCTGGCMGSIRGSSVTPSNTTSFCVPTQNAHMHVSINALKIKYNYWEKKLKFVKFEVLIVCNIKTTLFKDVTSYSPIKFTS